MQDDEPYVLDVVGGWRMMAPLALLAVGAPGHDAHRRDPVHLVEEIRAQAERFAQSHLAGGDEPALVTRIDHPELPGQFTWILEQRGEAVVLIVVDADHVLEETSKVNVRADLLAEGIRRAARCVYLDPHLAGHLRAALARSS